MGGDYLTPPDRPRVNLPPDEAALLREVKADFGIPDGESWDHLSVSITDQINDGRPVNEDLERWRGWRIDIFGPTSDPDGMDEQAGITAWLMRVYHPDLLPLMIEHRCRPGSPTRVLLGGLDDLTTRPPDANIHAALNGRWLLGYDLPHARGGGRRREYDDGNELQLLQELGDAVHAVVEQGHRSSYASIAKQLGHDRRSIKAWVEASPWDLQAIEHEALRCTGPFRVNSCTFHVRRAAEYRRKGV
jgi:hypothetical protein